jgi:site-specific DNA recombinase
MLPSRRVRRTLARGRMASEARAAIADRAAGYIRVSTEEQATTGHGLESQERAIRAFAASQDYALVEVVADPGISGATRPAERPGFSRLLELPEVSVLLVWKFDRLSRDLADAVTTVNDLLGRGVALRSVTEAAIDTTTPLGQMLFAIFAGMAQQERATITERTIGGKKVKASNGGFTGGMTPYGYARDGSGGMVVVEAEADVIRSIFAMRDVGLTLRKIADALNANNVPTKRGGKWAANTVAYILDNPRYRGFVEYLFGGEQHVMQQGQHEAII